MLVYPRFRGGGGGSSLLRDQVSTLSPTGEKKPMAFKGRDTVRTKIVIDNKIIEKVSSFNYLGNMIYYEKELDIDNKLHN
jgi:hypothetical protein